MRNLLLIVILAALPALAQPPGELAVSSATIREVRLTWPPVDPPPAAYVIERRLLDTAEFTTLQPQPGQTSFTDTAIAPYATYVYRLRTRNANATLSEPGPERTIGPPPAGLSLASPLAPAMDAYQLAATTHFAAASRVAFDTNGDPAIAYFIYSPRESVAETLLEFVSWNRAEYRWNPPRRIAVTGDALGSGETFKSLSLAHDSSTNAWAVSYIPDSSSPQLAVSTDDGQTWTVTQAYACGETRCSQTALALAGGRLHLAFLHAPDGIRYLTGVLADGPAVWKSELVPNPPGALEALPSLDLALDPDGRPAVAFWSNTDTYNLLLGLWRPGGPTITAMDTNGLQTDDPDIHLRFHGPHARMLAAARRNDGFYSRYDQNNWVVRELEGGFSAPASLPSDGDVSLAAASFTVSPTGALSIAAAEAGGTGEGVRCGLLKLIDQPGPDDPFRACSPIPRDAPEFAQVTFPRILTAPDGRRYLIFTNPAADSTLPGLLVWREH